MPIASGAIGRVSIFAAPTAGNNTRGAASGVGGLGHLPLGGRDPKGVAHAYRPFRSPVFSASSLYLSGVTKDSAGAVLGSCVVELFNTQADRSIAKTTSDPTTGAYSFQILVGGPFYVVAYKAGLPDVAGTTVNTLIGV